MCLFLMKNIQKSSAHNTSKVKSPPLNFWHGYLLLQFSGGCGEPMRFCVLLPIISKIHESSFFILYSIHEKKDSIISNSFTKKSKKNEDSFLVFFSSFEIPRNSKIFKKVLRLKARNSCAVFHQNKKELKKESRFISFLKEEKNLMLAIRKNETNIFDFLIHNSTLWNDCIQIWGGIDEQLYFWPLLASDTERPISAVKHQNLRLHMQIMPTLP